MVLKSLKQLSKSDAQSVRLTEAVETWRVNHEVLVGYILSEKLPYFGLHGTTQQGVDGILRDGGAHLEVGTFYDKKVDEFRLFQFYALCGYVSCYTRDMGGSPETEGAVFVFDLESDDGENITLPWENLRGSGGISELGLELDTPREAELFGRLEEGYYPNLLWRSDYTFQAENFGKRYRGMFAVSRLRNEVDDIAKKLALTRLDYQYDLARVLDLLRESK